MDFKITKKAVRNYIAACLCYFFAFVIMLIVLRFPCDVLLFDFSSAEVGYVLNLFAFIFIAFVYYTIYFWIHAAISSHAKYVNYLSRVNRAVHALLASALVMLLCYGEFLLYEYAYQDDPKDIVFWSYFSATFWTMLVITIGTNMFCFLKLKPRM